MSAAKEVARLRQLVNMTPKWHSVWSYRDILTFKAELVKAHKLLAVKNPNPLAITLSLKALCSFHEVQS